jgi:hypothetical protein
MTRKVHLFRFVVILFIAVSCEKKQEFYKKSDVQLLYSQVGTDSITVIYSTPLETLYYSPGVSYKYDENGRLIINILRSGISDKSKRGITKSVLVKHISDSSFNEYPPSSYRVKLPNQLTPKCLDKNCILISDE